MLIDFIIGFTIMNAMPHMLLGYGNIRFLALFGYGNRSNVAYAALNTIISAGLFTWKYGMEGWSTNMIYVGAVLILMIYWATGKWLIKFYGKRDDL